VELLAFSQGRHRAGWRVIEILGKPGDLGVDTEIIIRKHHLPARKFFCERPARGGAAGSAGARIGFGRTPRDFRNLQL